MPTSPIYTPINNSEIDADSPLTAALAFRWTFNPVSIMQGSPTARAAGMGVWVEKRPNPGDPLQTALLTDSTDTSLCVSPDGSGSFRLVTRDNVLATGDLKPDGTFLRKPGYWARNVTSVPVTGFTPPSPPKPMDHYTNSNRSVTFPYAIKVDVPVGSETFIDASLHVFTGDSVPGDPTTDYWSAVRGYIYRKRGGSYVLLNETGWVWAIVGQTVSVTCSFADIQENDEIVVFWAVWLDDGATGEPTVDLIRSYFIGFLPP